MTVSIHKSPDEGPHTGPKSKGQGRFGIFRYGAVLPVAALVTLGLMATMASFVATEFSPQDKTETAEFEINPVVEDIPKAHERLKLDPIKAVEVPPAPEPLPITKTAANKAPIAEITGKKIEFEINKIDLGIRQDSVNIDKDPSPIRRIPPVFPHRFLQGDVSGYCRVRFDVSPTGQPFNVSAKICTDRILKAPTLKAVRAWKYTPKIQNGRAVNRSGLETTIQFELVDERKRPLPLPSGY